MPIESDRGRGGGSRLQRNWALGRLHLSPVEAIDRLLSLAVTERMNLPLLLQHLAPIRRKIVAAFPEHYQPKIRSLRKRVLVGSPATKKIVASFSTKSLAAVSDCFFNMKCMRIVYVDQDRRETTRDVEPHFLYLSQPMWYLLCWDRMREAVRYFRIDRIRSVRPLEWGFRLGDPKPFLAEAEAGIATL